MEQGNNNTGGDDSLGVSMAVGLMLGVTLGAPSDNTGIGAGLGLLAGVIFYYIRRSFERNKQD